MNEYGVKQLGQNDVIQAAKARRSWRDFGKFRAEYWFLLLMVGFFYASVMPFVANSV